MTFTKATVGAKESAVLGEGITRVPQVIEKLNEIGYRGLVAIEYERAGNLMNDVIRCVEDARKLMT